MKIKLLSEHATIPTRGSEDAAGYDLYGANWTNVILQPHETKMIPIDIAAEIPKGYFGAIFARSGMACKRAMRPANCVGVIDSDYRGNITVAIHNDSEEAHMIQPGERIAQLVIIPYIPVSFDVVDELDDTDRGIGGFGSTGTK